MKFSLVAVGAVLAGIVIAVPAHADADAYLAELDKYGIQYKSASAAINMGQGICNALRSGIKFPAIANAITEPTPGTLNYTSREAGMIIGAAAGGLCPEMGPVLQAQMASIPAH